MELYKRLSIDTRINLKAICPELIGISFQELNVLFSFKERLNIIECKLRIEGIV